MLMAQPHGFVTLEDVGKVMQATMTIYGLNKASQTKNIHFQ